MVLGSMNGLGVMNPGLRLRCAIIGSVFPQQQSCRVGINAAEFSSCFNTAWSSIIVFWICFMSRTLYYPFYTEQLRGCTCPSVVLLVGKASNAKELE